MRAGKAQASREGGRAAPEDFVPGERGLGERAGGGVRGGGLTNIEEQKFSVWGGGRRAEGGRRDEP